MLRNLIKMLIIVAVLVLVITLRQLYLLGLLQQ